MTRSRASRDVPPGASWAFTEHRPLDERAAAIAGLLRAGVAAVDVCCRLLCAWSVVAAVAKALAAEAAQSSAPSAGRALACRPHRCGVRPSARRRLGGAWHVMASAPCPVLARRPWRTG